VHALEHGVPKKWFDRTTEERTAEAAYVLQPGAPDVSVAELLEHGIGLAPGAWNRSHQMRVARILVKLGWERTLTQRAGRREWRYARPSAPTHQPVHHQSDEDGAQTRSGIR